MDLFNKFSFKKINLCLLLLLISPIAVIILSLINNKFEELL